MTQRDLQMTYGPSILKNQHERIGQTWPRQKRPLGFGAKKTNKWLKKRQTIDNKRDLRMRTEGPKQRGTTEPECRHGYLASRHCNTLQHTAAHGATLQHTATHWNTLRQTAPHCATLQQTAAHFGAAMWARLPRERALQHAAAHGTTLQHIATHWNTLRHSTTHCDTLRYTATQLEAAVCARPSRARALQHTVTHCNTRQHTATHCNTLHHTAAHYDTATHSHSQRHTATHLGAAECARPSHGWGGGGDSPLARCLQVCWCVGGGFWSWHAKSLWSVRSGGALFQIRAHDHADR